MIYNLQGIDAYDIKFRTYLVYVKTKPITTTPRISIKTTTIITTTAITIAKTITIAKEITIAKQ